MKGYGKNSMRFHHIGIATKNINNAISDYKKYHKVEFESEIIFDKEQDAELAYLETNDGVNVEFISGKVVENIIKKGITYYHLCYETEDLDKSISELYDKGAQIVSPPKPAILFDMRRVAFLYMNYGVIELLESGN